MITSLLQAWSRAQMRRVAVIFVKTPITPNMLTIAGFFLNVIVAWLLGSGYLLAGGLMILFAGVFDLLDGALAKITNRMTQFGAFLDSMVDRYSEMVVFFGLLWYYLYMDNNHKVEALLIFVTITGSMMVSYARARAGSLHVDCEVGLMARPERIIILALALIFQGLIPDLITWALWVLAIGTQITGLQRLIYVWQQTQRPSPGPAATSQRPTPAPPTNNPAPGTNQPKR